MRQTFKDAKDKTSRMTQRQHLELLAERGSADALALLDGPELPETMMYLVRWLAELDHGREYDAMNGAMPYTWQAIDAWARRSGHDPNPDEIVALFILDDVLRHVPNNGSGAPVEELD